MSAGIILKQHNAAFILTDAAAYDHCGVVQSFRDKCMSIPELHCALLTFGSVNWREIITTGIRERCFGSYEAMRAGIEQLTRELFEANRRTVTTHPDGNGTEVFFIGWSKERQAPDAFVILLYDIDDLPKHFGPGTAAARPPFQIEPIEAMTHTPCPSAAQLRKARFPFSLASMTFAGLEQIRPEVDLLHLLEVQRRWQFEGGKYLVGGYAHLTRVDKLGISQKTIHTWAEDSAGESIQPLRLDWANWRAERDDPRASAKIIPMASPLLNRHQRRQLKASGRAPAPC
jgi:hypothetical protein